MAVGFFSLLIPVLLGLWVLNWLAVVVITAALGLRRRRWGTPGGGWAMVSAGLNAAIGLGLTVLVFGSAFIGGAAVTVLAPLSVVALLGLWLAANVASLRALLSAWQAADAVTRPGRPAPTAAETAP